MGGNSKLAAWGWGRGAPGGCDHREQEPDPHMVGFRVERLSPEWQTALTSYFGMVGKPESSHPGQRWNVSCALVPVQVNTVCKFEVLFTSSPESF